MRRWLKLGYEITVCGVTRDGKTRSWQATVPAEAVAFLPMKAGRVHISRYLSPPTGPRDAQNGPRRSGRGKSRRNY